MPGEARQDWWLIQELANRLDLNWTYTHPKDVYGEIIQVVDSMKGITWDRLENQDSVVYPCASEEEPGDAIIFSENFPTESGRAKLVPTDLVPPAETPDDEYPMVLTTGRLLEHWHTGAMTRRSTVLDTIEPEAVVHIHPKYMDQMGIQPGDMVNVHTRRGSIQVKARMDRDVTQGMLFVPFCFSEGPANLLTNPKLDPFGKIPEFKYCAARLEKIPQAAE